MTSPERVRELASTIAPCHKAGKVPANAAAPYSVLYGGTDNPLERMLSAAPIDRTTLRLVAVSNNHDGARTLARALRDVIDAADCDGDPLLVVFVSEPIEDRDDPSDLAWTSTLEIHHHPRS